MKLFCVLDFGENLFSGVVFVELLLRLWCLKYLCLVGNVFIGLFGLFVVYLWEIEIFDVSSNRLTGDLLKEFFLLWLLEILDVLNNVFIGMLVFFDGVEMLNLCVVDVESNCFVGVFLDGEFFKRASYLRYLRLLNNRIFGVFIDGVFDDVGELVELYVLNNDLFGLLLDFVCYLIKLKLLRLSGNARLGVGRGMFDVLLECWNFRVVEFVCVGFEGDIVDDVFVCMCWLFLLNLVENKFLGNVFASLKSVEFLWKLEI